MKAKKETRLKIKINGDDASTLKTAIDKLVKEINKVGFNNNFLTVDEKRVISKFSESLKC